jgi:DHA1 family tetracycline resistance protein-like MFS transporter
VIAPVIGAPLLGVVSHLPRNDWRVGAPFFFCSALLAVATVVAIRHFSRQTLSTAPATAAPADAT